MPESVRPPPPHNCSMFSLCLIPALHAFYFLSGLNGGAIAGIVIGVLVIGVLVALVAFFLYRRSQGQIVPPFTKREQILNEPGFDNAAYTSQENKVGFTEA